MARPGIKRIDYYPSQLVWDNLIKLPEGISRSGFIEDAVRFYLSNCDGDFAVEYGSLRERFKNTERRLDRLEAMNGLGA